MKVFYTRANAKRACYGIELGCVIARELKVTCAGDDNMESPSNRRNH